MKRIGEKNGFAKYSKNKGNSSWRNACDHVLY